MMKNYDFCERVLFSKEEISSAVSRIASLINEEYKGEEVIFLPVLNGAFMFATDLVKEITLKCSIDFIQCSTYEDGVSSTNKFVMKKDLSKTIEGKNVIVVEDILDSGYTLKNLVAYLKSKNPKSVKTAVFMDKKARRTEDITADYVAVELNEDAFVIGYGLDYAEKYRNVPYVGVLKPEIYTHEEA